MYLVSTATFSRFACDKPYQYGGETSKCIAHCVHYVCWLGFVLQNGFHQLSSWQSGKSESLLFGLATPTSAQPVCNGSVAVVADFFSVLQSCACLVTPEVWRKLQGTP